MTPDDVKLKLLILSFLVPFIYLEIIKEPAWYRFTR